MAKGKTLKDVAAEKLSDVIVVHGITVEGVTPEDLNDFEIMEAFAIMSDPDADAGVRLRAIASIAPVIFGAKQWKRIKAELREQNDGRLPNEVAMEFITGVIDALSSKNS